MLLTLDPLDAITPIVNDVRGKIVLIARGKVPVSLDGNKSALSCVMIRKNALDDKKFTRQARRNQDSDCRRMIYETSDRTAQCFAISLMVQSFDMTRLGFNITAPVHARVSVGSIVV
jgi:hypothetical protein